MKLQKLSCPNCNGSLRINVENKDRLFCPYCGQAFSIDDGRREYTINRNENIVKTVNIFNHNINHTINDSEIIKAQNERYFGAAGIVGLVLLIIANIFIWGMIGREVQERNDSIYAREIISAGSSEDYIGEGYEAVVTQLETLGFTNISTVGLNDSGLKFWTKNKVESVSIDGQTSFDSSNYYSPDAIIIVKYH